MYRNFTFNAASQYERNSRIINNTTTWWVSMRAVKQGKLEMYAMKINNYNKRIKNNRKTWYEINSIWT